MNLLRRSISLLMVAASVTAFLQSCGEKVPLPQRKSTFDITYSGDLYLGDSIQFQTNAPAGKHLLWLFGDGESSIETSPKHAFLKPPFNGADIALDTVTLIVDHDIYQPNKIAILLKPGIKWVVGNYTWKGGKFRMHGTCCPGLSDHALADTVFPVTAWDEYTVKCWGNNLRYLADSNYYSNERSTGMYNGTWVIYTRDTLFFRQRTGDENGWAETTYYHKF